MRKLLQALKRDERGVTALEYVILAVFVVIAVAAGGLVLKNVITSAFNSTGTFIQSCIDTNGANCGS